MKFWYWKAIYLLCTNFQSQILLLPEINNGTKLDSASPRALRFDTFLIKEQRRTCWKLSFNLIYFRSVEKGRCKKSYWNSEVMVIFIFFRSLIPESRMAFFFLLEIWLFREGHFSIFILCWNYLGNFSDIQQKVTSCSPARMIKIKIKKKLQQTVNGRILFFRHFTTTCCFWIFCWLSKESVRKTCQQNKMFYLSITRVHLLYSISLKQFHHSTLLSVVSSSSAWILLRPCHGIFTMVETGEWR